MRGIVAKTFFSSVRTGFWSPGGPPGPGNLAKFWIFFEKFRFFQNVLKWWDTVSFGPRNVFWRVFRTSDAVFRFLWFVDGCLRSHFGDFSVSRSTPIVMAKLRFFGTQMMVPSYSRLGKIRSTGQSAFSVRLGVSGFVVTLVQAGKTIASVLDFLPLRPT